MKQAIIFLFFISSSCLLKAQDSVDGTKRHYKKAVTTEEEYNYMSKGYKIQVESGLDMKKGYLAGEAHEIKVNAYIFKYTTLLKVSGKDTFNVGYITNATSTSWGNTYWYGIPLNNEVLLSKMQTQVSLLDCPMISAFFKSYLQLTLMYNP